MAAGAGGSQIPIMNVKKLENIDNQSSITSSYYAVTYYQTPEDVPGLMLPEILVVQKFFFLKLKKNASYIKKTSIILIVKIEKTSIATRNCSVT